MELISIAKSIAYLQCILLCVNEMNKKAVIYVRGLAHLALKYLARLEVCKQGCTFQCNTWLAQLGRT